MLLDNNLLAPISRNMSQMHSLLTAEQTELDIAEAEVVHQTDQLYIGYVDSEISRYERMFAIVNTSGSIEQRRNRIIAKLNTRSPATVKTIERIVEVITGAPCSIEEHYDKYAMTLRYRTDGDYIALQQDVKDAVDEIKPAHIAYMMMYQMPITAPLFTASHHTTATRIKVLPYMPSNIATQPTSSAMYAVAKTGTTIKIQPKGVI